MAKVTVTIPNDQRDNAQALAKQSNLTLAQVLSIHVAQICNTQSLGIRQNNVQPVPTIDNTITSKDIDQAVNDFKNNQAISSKEMLKKLDQHAASFKSKKVAND